MSKPRVKCPTCEKPQVYDTSNPHRPFCSERCRQIDLGAWASEEYAIAESKAASDFSSGVLEEHIDQDQPSQPSQITETDPTPPTMH